MATKTLTDAELLANIDADRDGPVGPAVDAAPLRALAAAVRRRDQAEADVSRLVESARSAGLSWAVIGAELGVTRQGALKRYGHGRD